MKDLPDCVGDQIVEELQAVSNACSRLAAEAVSLSGLAGAMGSMVISYRLTPESLLYLANSVSKVQAAVNALTSHHKAMLSLVLQNEGEGEKSE